MVMQGIDVSHYQNDVDWYQVANAGYEWAGFKVTEGLSFVDLEFWSNREESCHAGIRYRLGYHWLTPHQSAAAQASHFVRTIGRLDPGEGVMLDAEESSTRGTITEAQTLEWCERVEQVTQRPVAVYTGVFVAHGTIWRSPRVFDGTRPRILAAYITEVRARRLAEPFWGDAWQYTSSGTVPGVPTRCDLDRIDNPAAFDPCCGLDTRPAPTPPVPVEDNDMVIITNAEQFFADAPGTTKFLLLDNGHLRHLGPSEWAARGSAPGVPWTNDEIATAGVSEAE